MTFIWRCLLLVTFLVLPQTVLAADPVMDPELRSKARRATDAGLRYLRGTQAEDGSWSGSIGVTALALRAFLTSHRGYSEGDGAFITRPVQYLLYHVRTDGAISEGLHNTNYNTATAIFALKLTGNPAYDEVIKNAQRFLAGLQVDEDEGYEPSHKYYGGVGYGGDERPDLSNMYYALEALRETAMDPNDPVWEKAITFVSRSQNRSESNDQEWATNDGGFTYMPGYSPHGGTGSYGAMTDQPDLRRSRQGRSPRPLGVGLDPRQLHPRRPSRCERQAGPVLLLHRIRQSHGGDGRNRNHHRRWHTTQLAERPCQKAPQHAGRRWLVGEPILLPVVGRQQGPDHRAQCHRP